MNLKFKWVFIVCFALNISFSQDKDEVLLTVDGDPIMASEFLRVYNKNLDLVQDENQKDIDAYLKLFTEYQLKLKEAKRLKLHDDSKYKREFLKYKQQLTKNYLSENKVTDALVKEGYERNNIDINASHVLVRLDATSKDTLNAYNQVLKLRERVLNEGFDVVKADMHNGTTIFLEDLGYFSAFKMVYEFETAAYNTPKGDISMPFRTQFGYHVVKINDRRKSRGTMTAAHIMVALNAKDSLLDAEERIHDIHKKIKQGESFESLAKQFSDDKSSAKNGGKLSPFKSGQLSSSTFEDKAFALTSDNDITTPFKTQYGWHIVKRLRLQPVQTFEDQKSIIEAKVKRDSRSKLISKAMVNELKKRYNISYTPEAKTYFKSILTNAFFSRAWASPESLKNDEIIFVVNDKSFSYKDFSDHLTSAQREYMGRSGTFEDIINVEYDKFFEKCILQYREDNLEFENKDFANILKEYRDGLLLFDLMEKEIWNKASKDSAGLEHYYAKHISKYQWKDRVEVIIGSSAKKATANKVLQMMKAGLSEADIKDKLNSNKESNVLFTKGIFNTTDSKLPPDLKIEKGIYKTYKHNDAFHAIYIKNVLPSGNKTLEEAKGNVINDYQTEIETNWIKDLYNRFEVNVNNSVLKAIKTKLNKQ